MAKRKRLSRKSVHKRAKVGRKRKRKIRRKKKLFNACKEYSDHNFILTPEEVKSVTRKCLKVAKSSVWGASKISLRRPRIFWNLSMRTHNGRAMACWKKGSRIGEVHLNASEKYINRRTKWLKVGSSKVKTFKEAMRSTLVHEIAHIIQFRVGNRMGHRKDFKLILSKLSKISF